MEATKKLLNIARDRRKTLKKEKNKKKSSNNNNTFFTWFIQKKLYFAGKHIWKILVYIVDHDDDTDHSCHHFFPYMD